MDLEKLRQMASQEVIDLNPEVFGVSAKPAAKRNKFNAIKREVDGIVFDSGAEARRYCELALLLEAGIIANLQRQVTFTLQDPFVDHEGVAHRAVKYTADFVYLDRGKTVIEDVKSPATAKGEAFRIRWRLLLKKFETDSSVRCVLTS